MLIKTHCLSKIDCSERRQALSHRRDVVAAKNPGLCSSPGTALMAVLTRDVTQPFISNSNYFLRLPMKEGSVSQQALRDVCFEPQFKIASWLG